MPDAPAKPRRWFRFSVRTLFVVVTALACWLGYELNWIRQRHAILAEAQHPMLLGDYQPAKQLPILEMFHEPPVDSVTAGTGLPEAEFNRLKWLFPEAEVSRAVNLTSREIFVVALQSKIMQIPPRR
jgi:hypothetical protein